MWLIKKIDCFVMGHKWRKTNDFEIEVCAWCNAKRRLGDW